MSPLRCRELFESDPDGAFDGWQSVQLRVNPDEPGSVDGIRAQLRQTIVPSRAWCWFDEADDPIGTSTLGRATTAEGGQQWWAGVTFVDGTDDATWDYGISHVADAARIGGAGRMTIGARSTRPAQQAAIERTSATPIERLIKLERRLSADDSSGVDIELVRGRPMVSLAERPDLAPAWLDADLAFTRDIPGETTDVAMTVEQWRAWIDDTPTVDMARMWALLGPDDSIDAIVQFTTNESDPGVFEIAMLGILPSLRGAGLGRELKRWMHAMAWSLGARRLETVNHAGNAPMEYLNAQLGYRLVYEFVQYELALVPTPNSA